MKYVPIFILLLAASPALSQDTSNYNIRLIDFEEKAILKDKYQFRQDTDYFNIPTSYAQLFIFKRRIQSSPAALDTLERAFKIKKRRNIGCLLSPLGFIGVSFEIKVLKRDTVFSGLVTFLFAAWWYLRHEGQTIDCVNNAIETYNQELKVRLNIKDSDYNRIVNGK